MEIFIYDMKGIIKSFGIFDFIDISVVAYLIYHAIRLLRDTRAIQLIKGLAVMAGIYAVASISGMRSLSFFDNLYLPIRCFGCVYYVSAGIATFA